MEDPENQVKIIEEKIKRCAAFVEKYEWLSESFVVDFFTQNIWDTKIPASWSSALANVKPSDLEQLLDYESDIKLCGLEWPPEILEMREKGKLFLKFRSIL
jgi:hypothetical protein